jgi:PIN domain nuclease of toxin-antitoxin system
VNLLLDSHALLWALLSPEKLSERARREIASCPRLFFSAASVWELEIKRAREKLFLPEDWIESAEAEGFSELPIQARHAQESGRLPWHNKDPFDRMLVAQARCEGLVFASRDRFAPLYGVPLLEV